MLGRKASCLVAWRGLKGVFAVGARLSVVSLVWVLFGCSTLQVNSDYDAAVDFSVLHSYDWLPSPRIKSGDPAIQYDSLMEQRVKSAVEVQLAAKGFRRQAEHPDVLVTYHVAVDRKISVTYLNELYGYGPGWGVGYRRNMLHYGYPSSEAIVTEYQQGTLIIDIVSASDKQLIWRGTASDEVYPDNSAEAREKRVREAVQKILALFPPPDSKAGD